MRVIVVNYRFFIAGGPERYLFNFMEAATRRGIEVIPFSVKNARNEPTEYEPYFAKPRADALYYADTKRTLKNMYGMLRSVVWNFDAARRLRRLIGDTRPDAVYILHEINHLSPSVIRAAKKEGVRVVHRISDFFMFCASCDFLCEDEICEACIHGRYKEAVRKRCVKRSLSATLLRVAAMKLYRRLGVFGEVDRFVVPSAFTVEKMKEGGIPEDRILQIPTFIDSERIVPCYAHEKYFLFLGRIARQKGVIYALQAMDVLRESDYRLKITGALSDSGEDRELLQYIEAHHLEERIVFTGFLEGEELDGLIDHAACIVCPSIWYENMPNAVLEAYAHGKPVVASGLGSLTEMVEEGVTGFLFPPGDSVGLARQLEKFIKDETLSLVLGRAARERCETKYGEALHMQKILSCLRGREEDRLR